MRRERDSLQLSNDGKTKKKHGKIEKGGIKRRYSDMLVGFGGIGNGIKE